MPIDLDVDDFMGFVEFGLDRKVPSWRACDTWKPIVHIGPGNKKLFPGFGVKVVEYDFPQFDFDGEGYGSSDPIPHESNSVGGIFATHVLEHLGNPRWLIAEAARVLAPGCPFNILVPHADSLMFKQDLDHKTPFVLDTWRNFLENPYYTKSREKKIPFVVGVNITFAVKEGNTAIITQLIKTGE